MAAQGADWWGYAEGNELVLGTIAVVFLLFAGAYLWSRLRDERKSRPRP